MRKTSLALALLAALTVGVPVEAHASAKPAAAKAAPLNEKTAIAAVRSELLKYPKIKALLGRIDHHYVYEPTEGHWVSVYENRDSHVTRLWSFLVFPEGAGYKVEAYDVLTDGTIPFETFLKENQLK